MPVKTREQRIADIEDAAKKMRAALKVAMEVEESSATLETKHEAWAEVELWASVCHRQGRLAAGKSRAG